MTMPIPATPKKLPMNAVVTERSRHPMSAKERVVKVVANAPMARAVGLPSCALIVMGTGMYCTLSPVCVEPGLELEALAAWPEASFS